MKKERIGIDGIFLAVRYRKERSGRTAVVFLHGLSCAGSHYEAAFDSDALKRKSIVVPDLPGFGESDKPGGYRYSVQSAARLVAKLLDRLGAERITAVGHSMGGAVAAELTKIAPDLVSCLVLAEANLTPLDAYWSERIKNEPLEDYRRTYERLADRWSVKLMKMTPGEENLELTLETYRQTDYRAMHGWATSLVETTFAPEYLEHLRSLDIPVYYIAGERTLSDWLVPPDLLPTDAPGDRFYVVPDAGHLMMLDNPGAFYSAIAEIAISCP